MSAHDWRNWQSCRCGERGCLSSHHQAMVADLAEVLDIEAGLREIIGETGEPKP